MRDSTSWTLGASAILVALGATSVVAAPTSAPQNSSCRVSPGDLAWPDQSKWAQLNTTLNGRLMQTVPLATVCHGSSYDQAACDKLQQDWPYEPVHESSASSIMAPWFQNATCDPYTPVTNECRLGNYVSYSIQVTGPDDAIAGVKFAQDNNMRLVIKNTGHDYMGKSSGAGGLGLWTHSMNSTTFISNYTSRYYSGPAFRFGAGVIGAEAYEAAKDHGMRVVGGDCPSVGLAGGYTQGGGHSILTSQNGMGADQVLEWEVVTAQGEHIIATPDDHQDLYWALSGGGGGTYGVVISLTIRVFPDERTGGAVLSITSADANSDEQFWRIYRQWQDRLADLVDVGATAIFIVDSTGFSLSPLTVPGATEDDVRLLLSGFTSQLDQMNRTYSLNVTSFPSYFGHLTQYFGPFPSGPWPNAQTLGGRMIPRQTVQQNGDALVSAVRTAVASPPFYVSSIAQNANNAGKTIKYGVKTSAPIADNAVLPAWRSTLIHMLVPGPWNFTAGARQHQADMEVLASKLDPLLKQVTGPEGANYLNEANFIQPDFKTDFYGSNYGALRAVKARYDPKSLFWARTAVGSDEWIETGEGRLCRS